MSRLRDAREQQQDERERRQGEIADMQALLADPMFRRFVTRVLEHTGIGRTVWSPSAEIHRKAGMQDVGLWIIEELTEADATAWVTMQYEQVQRNVRVERIKERA